jgi:hypothetical protein
MRIVTRLYLLCLAAMPCLSNLAVADQTTTTTTLGPHCALTAGTIDPEGSYSLTGGSLSKDVIVKIGATGDKLSLAKGAKILSATPSGSYKINKAQVTNLVVPAGTRTQVSGNKTTVEVPLTAPGPTAINVTVTLKGGSTLS